MTLTLVSPAFSDNGAIPARYTCEGDDVSPPLTRGRELHPRRAALF